MSQGIPVQPSEDTGDDLSGHSIGADGGEETQHREATVEFLGALVVSLVDAVFHLLFSGGINVHLRFAGPHVLLAAIIGGNSHM